MSNSPSSTQFLDASGLQCPMPLLKTKLALKPLQCGDVLHVRATDSGSWRDIRKYVELSGHELVDARAVENCYEFWIKKGA